MIDLLAGAHDVGRADLGDHFGGDHPHDTVEPLLRAARPGHDAAQAAQQAPDRGDMPILIVLGDCWRASRRAPWGVADDLAHPGGSRPSAAPENCGGLRSRRSRAAMTARAWSTSSA